MFSLIVRSEIVCKGEGSQYLQPVQTVYVKSVNLGSLYEFQLLAKCQQQR